MSKVSRLIEMALAPMALSMFATCEKIVSFTNYCYKWARPKFAKQYGCICAPEGLIVSSSKPLHCQQHGKGEGLQLSHAKKLMIFFIL